MKTIFQKILLSAVLFLGLMAHPSNAEDGFVINSQESSISCIVSYTLIGKYKPEFQEFNGLIYFNPKDLAKSSVYLKIKTSSVKSKYATLDRIARSHRLLDASTYPDIVFQSQKIEKTKDGYLVTGSFNLHGVTKVFKFPFQLVGPIKSDKKQYLIANGKWLLDRKKFNVIWDKHLDKGGIVVGDEITIDWKIKAYK